MQRLGFVLHVSPSRNIIVKLEKTSKIGENVVDENLGAVGTVFDIFGPMSSPYTAVRPIVRQPESLVNKRLYVVPSKRREEKKRR